MKKAKKLRAEGKTAKAQKLEAKAAKQIQARAKKLARKPLGSIMSDHHQPGQRRLADLQDRPEASVTSRT